MILRLLDTCTGSVTDALLYAKVHAAITYAIWFMQLLMQLGDAYFSSTILKCIPKKCWTKKGTCKS